MIWFRRKKIEKILDEYGKLYEKVIPRGVVGYEELCRLKAYDLLDLTVAYDVLDGFQHAPDLPCPAMSLAFPGSVMIAPTPSNNKILRLRRIKYYKDFVAKGEYHNYPAYDAGLKLIDSPPIKWKIT